MRAVDEGSRLFAHYVPPASHVAAAIQYPMTDVSWPDRIVTAYMRDWRASRRQAAENAQKGRSPHEG